MTTLNQIDLIPVKETRPFSSLAMEEMTPLFDWLKDAKEPVLRLLEARQGTEDGTEAAAAWCTLTRAHALDLYHDAGIEALSWPHALLHGLHTLTLLLIDDGDWQPGGQLDIQADVMRLEFMKAADADMTGGVNMGEGQQRVLTMDDVARDLLTRSPAMALDDTELLCDYLPSASLPALALATGTLMALVIAGRLTGFETMTLGGGELDWAARLTWTDAGQGVGPTGEALD